MGVPSQVPGLRLGKCLQCINKWVRLSRKEYMCAPSWEATPQV